MDLGGWGADTNRAPKFPLPRAEQGDVGYSRLFVLGEAAAASFQGLKGQTPVAVTHFFFGGLHLTHAVRSQNSCARAVGG